MQGVSYVQAHQSYPSQQTELSSITLTAWGEGWGMLLGGIWGGGGEYLFFACGLVLVVGLNLFGELGRGGGYLDEGCNYFFL